MDYNSHFISYKLWLNQFGHLFGENVDLGTGDQSVMINTSLSGLAVHHCGVHSLLVEGTS